jgi:hypothetical protein
MSYSSGILTLQDGRGTLTASLNSYVKIGELNYTNVNLAGTVSTIALTSINAVPGNSKIVSIYGKVNQAFVSPTAQITGYGFYAAPGGTNIPFDWGSFSNFFSPNDLLPTSSLYGLDLFAMTQSYIHSNALQFVSQTYSLTYSVYLSYSDGSMSVLNPQDWTAGNVSFVVEYQPLNLSSLPF